jgi:type IV pilus assembly protein PilE
MLTSVCRAGPARGPLHGFTLLELAIVMAMVSILAALAWPSYQAHGVRARAQEGMRALTDARARMEQHYLNSRTYVGGPCASAVTVDSFAVQCTSSPTAEAYTITATGSGAAAGLVYTLDHHGSQRTTGLPSSWGTVPSGGHPCWIGRQGDTC